MKTTYTFLLAILMGIMPTAQAAEQKSSAEHFKQTPLMIAAANNDLENARKILRRDPMSLQTHDRQGRTALMYAIYPALRNQQDKELPIVATEEVGSIPMIELLLSNKANINDVDRKGRSALAYAIASNQPPVVDLLLQHNASTDLRLADKSSIIDLKPNYPLAMNKPPKGFEDKRAAIQKMLQPYKLQSAEDLSEQLRKCNDALQKARLENSQLKQRLNEYEPGA